MDCRSILERWDIGPVADVRALGCSRDAWRATTADGQRYVLKRNPHWHDVGAAAAVLARLEQQGLPVPTPLPTRGGGLCETEGGARFCLSRFLPGRVPTGHYGPGGEARAAALGEGIARLHRALARCDGLARSRQFNLTQELRGPIQELLRSRAQELWSGVGNLHAELTEELAALEPQLPVQVIHRDAHPGNLLLDAGRVSGYLDFDLVVRAVRLYDLAYCSTAMLAGGEAPVAWPQRWFALLPALVEGYERLSPLAAAERQGLCHVQRMIQFDFAAFHTNRGRPDAARRSLDAMRWLHERRGNVLESVA